MKKPTGILLALFLTAAACGGSAPEEPTGEGGIAALEQEDEKDASGGSRAKGESGGKVSGPKKGGGSKSPSGGGGESGTVQQPSGGGSGSGGNGGGAGSGSTGSAAAPAPIPQGEHRYATEGQRTISGNTSELPKTTTLTAAAPAGGVQRQARDLRDSDGNGTLTETDLRYGPNGVFLSYVKVTSRFQGGITDVREFELARPQLVAPAGGGPGFTRTFTMRGSGTSAKVTVTAHRWENVSIGGRGARTLVVETDIRFSGALEGYQRSVTWFWPQHLLPLKEQVQTDVSNGPIRLQSTYHAEIERLP